MRLILGTVCIAASAPLLAQSPYVSGSAELNAFRVTHTSVAGFELPSGSGEAEGASLRLGTALGDRWGLELEAVRSGGVTADGGLFGPRTAAGPFRIEVSEGLPGVLPGPLLVPFEYRPRTVRRHTGVNALGWVRQPLSRRVDLAYLGGVAFGRESQQISITITPLLRTLAPIRQQRTTVTEYHTGAVAGVETRIAITDHVRLVPGIRLQSLGNGWLLRAGVGAGWWF